MRLSTNGILVNELGQILLIQRNDTRTFAPPGGGVEAAELPTVNITREIQEETGLIALPVRLVSLNYWPLQPTGLLTFTFRCLQRGGELQPSPESPRVGFFSPHALPKPMLTLSKKRIEQGVKHAGGPVDWWTIQNTAVMRLGRFLVFNVVYRWLDLKRKLQKQAPYTPPPFWEATVYTVVQDESGAILQQKTAEGWHLPGGLVPGLAAPWQTAVTLTQAQTGVSVRLTNLSGVYVPTGENRIILVFTAVVEPPVQHTYPSQTQWLTPMPLPQKAETHQHHYIRDALAPGSETIFRYITANGECSTAH